MAGSTVHHPPASEVAELLHRAIDAHSQEIHELRQKLQRADAEMEQMRECLRRRGLRGKTEEEADKGLPDDGDANEPPKNGARKVSKQTTLSDDNKLMLLQDASGKQFKFRDAWERNPSLLAGHPENIFVLQDYSMSSIGTKGGKRRTRAKKTLVNMSSRGIGSSRWIIRPDSTWRLGWDVVGLILIFYDFLTIPFMLSFDVASNEYWALWTMDWITLLFWTADMCQGAFLAYFKKEGQLETNNKKVLMNYLTGWCLIDVLVVFPGWMMKAGDISSGGPDQEGAQVGFLAKVLKSARAIRILRLVRLVKLQRILNTCYDRIEDERKLIFVNLLNLLAAVTVLNHLIACIWHAIGDQADSAGAHRNWVRTYLRQYEHSLLDKYLVSLHWSMTQFTPASMSVSATNEQERAFSIIVLFFAMVCFSSIVGSITGAMTTLRSINSATNRQFWLLRRYLRQQQVKPDLRRRVCKFLEFQLVEKPRRVEVSQLPIMKRLSDDLTFELNHAEHWPVVAVHPCFQLMHKDEYVHTRHLCFECLSMQIWAESEKLFQPGDEGRRMYFFKEAEEVSGEKPGLELEFKFGFGEDSEGVEPRSWISEAVLWTTWRHLGELRCNVTCDILAVDPEAFASVLRRHPRPWFLAKVYGLLFLDYINSVEPDDLSDVLYDEHFQEYIRCVEAGDVHAVDRGSFDEFIKTFGLVPWYQEKHEHDSGSPGRKSGSISSYLKGLAQTPETPP